MADLKNLPPTEKQLLRVQELLEHPAMDDHLDTLNEKMGKMLSNRGSIGVLISWMKRIISRYEPAEDYAEDDAAVQAILDAAKKLRPEK